MKTLLCFVLSLGICLGAMAQEVFVTAVRPIPAEAQKAKMFVVEERLLNLNGRVYKLATGGRIFNEKNLIVQTQSLTSTYSVRVMFDAQGLVQRLWILTAAEDQVSAPILEGPTLLRRLLPWLIEDAVSQ